MARDGLAADQGPQRPAEFDAAVWLEAHGLLHNYGDGCEHCDNWTARHWPNGQCTACTDPRCACVLGC